MVDGKSSEGIKCVSKISEGRHVLYGVSDITC